MKHKTLALSLALVLAATGCVVREPEVSDTEEEEQAELEELEETEESELPSQLVVHELANPSSPETVAVTFEAQFGGDLDSAVEIEDLLNIDVFHSQVRGRIGSPIEITFLHVESGVLTFAYDPDELRGIPEENIIMLHYNGFSFDTMEDAVLDTDGNTISLALEEDGVYILVDSLQWNNWDSDTIESDVYGVSTGDYESNWERERDTGSIVELADADWANANAPDFHVSTAEELASVVYYVNATADPHPFYTIEIEADIDLTGYEWEPMGWTSVNTSSPFRGTINGNGHTITGMHIEVGYIQAGFVGYGMDVEVNDITFVEAYVSSTGGCGIVGGEVYGNSIWTNVSVQGEVEGSSDDYGGLVGRETAISFVDCNVECTVSGEPFPYCSYADFIEATTEVEEAFTLTLNDDYTVTRDENPEFDDISWHIEVDGIQVLVRNADNELTLPTGPQWNCGGYGTYSIWLVSWQNGSYVRVSNIVEYERIP